MAPSQFAYRYDQEQIVTSEELAAALQSSATPLLVDARPPRFFSGEARVDAAAGAEAEPMDLAGFARDLTAASAY